MLDEGDPAPDFEARGVHGGEFDTYRLADHLDRGENVLLTFYAFDFNPVCVEGMCSLRDTDWFSLTENLAVLGVSGDSVYSHREFAERYNIDFPLLADTDHAIAEAYGVLRDEYEGMRRVTRRSVFLIDADGIVRFAAGVDAESPEEIDLTPVEAAVQSLAAD
jgi:peroxiredoxin